MRRLESIEDDMNRVVTYEMPDGKRLRVDRAAVERHGIREIAKAHGVEMSTERVPVFHWGERVGTLPAGFDPAFIKSKSLFYTPRPGDFTRTADGWLVSNTMGPGDVAAVPGFQSEVRTHREHW